MTQRRHIEERGTVQGVGFRPFVDRLGVRHGLAGWVLNRSGDVAIVYLRTCVGGTRIVDVPAGEQLPRIC